MPVNPAVNSRIVGGSSSGSAVAVSANLVDFAIGESTSRDTNNREAFVPAMIFYFWKDIW